MSRLVFKKLMVAQKIRIFMECSSCYSQKSAILPCLGPHKSIPHSEMLLIFCLFISVFKSVPVCRIYLSFSLKFGTYFYYSVLILIQVSFRLYDHPAFSLNDTRYCNHTFLVYFFIKFVPTNYGRFITMRYNFKQSRYNQNLW